MDSQQTPRTQNELSSAGQKTAMVKQGPPGLANLQNHPPPASSPQQYQPTPTSGPRYAPTTNNGPSDGQPPPPPPPRYPLQGGPPPLRHLGPSGPQFPPPRPPYGPGGPPQRAPPPRNIFFGRPPPPPASQSSPSPTGGPQRFPPPGQQFQGQPRPPPQLYSSQQQQQQQQQGYRPPSYPPASPGSDPRGPRPILQRTESLLNSSSGDPRLSRPSYLPQQQSQLPAQQSQLSPQQQQLISNWRGHLQRQQQQLGRMADVELNQQPQPQRPPSNASTRSEDLPARPRGSISENGKSSDSESEGKERIEERRSSVVELQKNAVHETPKRESPAKGTNRASPVREAPKTPPQTAAKKPESRRQSVIEKSSDAILQDCSAESKSQIPPKTPDSMSIKGFDDGKRKSLSSPKSPLAPPTPPPGELAGGKKKTTSFVEESEKTIEERSVVTARKDRAGMRMPIAPGKADAENDSGVDESTQRREGSKPNGLASSPAKCTEKKMSSGSPLKSPSKSIRSIPRTPEAGPPPTAPKKVPMNKVQVGAAPSPNLKVVRSKIGSLDNATYKPGGGKVKIENRKVDFSSAQSKIAAKNDKYMPSGGDKKIPQVKLQWNAKSKIGSLENATYRPGGGDKKIESVKLDFKDKAKPKVGSKENAKHVPGGGNVKSSAQAPKSPQDNANNIETQKVDIKAESKIGSMGNMKHKPGGGDKKIFDDKLYLRQTSSNVGSTTGSGSQSPVPSNAGSISDKNGLPMSDENLNK